MKLKRDAYECAELAAMCPVIENLVKDGDKVILDVTINASLISPSKETQI